MSSSFQILRFSVTMEGSKMSFYTHSDIIEAKMCNNCAIKKHQFIFVYCICSYT